MIRFMHAADLHLGVPFTGLGKHADAYRDMIVRTSQDALVSLIDTCLDEHCAFIIIAGDVFDSSHRDVRTALFFAKQMERLYTAGIHALIIFGNHDAESDLFALPWPSNVHIFSSERAETVILREHGVALHGQSYSQRHEPRNLSLTYPNPVPRLINIGILHTSLEGSNRQLRTSHSAHPHTHEAYAPCSVDDLKSRHYDYWALGHVHTYSIRSQSPWIVYPGSLFGRSIRETGPKGSVLVDLDQTSGHINCKPCVHAKALWHHLDIPLTGVLSVKDIIHHVSNHVVKALDRRQEQLSILRITLSGKTRHHEELNRSNHNLSDDIRIALTARLPNVCLERVVIATQPSQKRTENKTLYYLTSALDQVDALARQELTATLEKELAPLLRKLPHDARTDTLPYLEDALSGRHDDLLNKVMDQLRCDPIDEDNTA